MQRTLLEIPEKKKNKIHYSQRTNSEGPFYDPSDIHIHRYKIGTVIKQNKNEIFKNDGKPQDNVNYCIVCHEIKNNNKLSDTRGMSMVQINQFTKTVGYKCPETQNNNIVFENKPQTTFKEPQKALEQQKELPEPRKGLFRRLS